MNNSDSQAVAQTILAQLGGNRFVAMTGAKNLVALESGFQFDLPRAALAGINRVQVEYETATDTYTVIAWKINSRAFTFDEKGRVSAVYSEDLQRIFTLLTGLATCI